MINYDSKVEQKKYKNVNPFAPQWPFRCLMVGGSASGKTNLLLNFLLNNLLYYDKLYLYSKSLEQPKYQYLIKAIEDICEKKDIDIGSKLFYSDDINAIKSLEELDKNVQNLVVFDDLLTEKNQETISTYFVKSRHKNCSLFYLSQSYFQTQKLIRQNSTHYILYKTNGKNLDVITSDLATSIEVKEFKRIFKSVTNIPFNYVLLDPFNKDQKMRFRDGLFQGIEF